MNIKHQEYSYLNLLKEILNNGEKRSDRTNTGVLSLFGKRMEFDLTKEFPLITTKRMWMKGIIEELLFFISGKTNSLLLESKGVNIWKGNTNKEYLEENNLPWNVGDMGPLYPFQWRHAGEKYEGCDKKYQGIDQLQQLINNIIIDPFSRRHIISAWDVANIKNMVLPPCHCLVQFYVGGDSDNNPKYLDCCLTQRSGDMFLGIPFNIASYSLLTYIICHLTNLTPRKFIHNLGDAHIYINHVEQIKEQLSRIPLPFPQLSINRNSKNIDDIKIEDINLINYDSWEPIKGIMAI